MRHLPSRVASLLLVLVVLAGLPLAGQAATPTGTPAASPVATLAALREARVGDADPATAAIDVSQQRFGRQEADVVVLARDDLYVDALSAAPLTSRGPLLLTPSDRLTPAVADEITRVLRRGGRVLLVGGEAALAPRVASQVAALERRVARVAGDDRVATAIAIADELVGTARTATVAVARGRSAPDNGTSSWADAVTAGAWATRTGTPILVVDGRRGDARVDAWSRAHGVTRTVVLGGPAAVADVAVANLAGVRRVAGEDRAGTAAAIAQQLDGPTLGDDLDGALLLNTWGPFGWARGLAAAGLAADTDRVVLAVRADRLPPATVGWLDDCAIEPGDVTAVGPTSILADATLAAARSAASCAPATPPAAGTSYTFVARDAAGDPIAYDGCVPLRIAVNLDGAPSDASTRVDAAFARLSEATGLTIRRSTTTERLPSPTAQRSVAVGPDGTFPPVLLNWPADWSGSSAIGYAGSTWTRDRQGSRFVTGSVSIRPGVTDQQLSTILLHELGHLVGLDHVEDPAQLMFPTVSSSVTDYRAGDLAGLAQLGGC